MRSVPSLLLASLLLSAVAIGSGSDSQGPFMPTQARAKEAGPPRQAPGQSRQVAAPSEGCELAGRVVAAPNVEERNELRGIDGSDPNNIWAVGKYVGTDPRTGEKNQESLALRWDGREWTNVPIHFEWETGDHDSYLNDVAVLAPDNVWAVGASGSAGDYWPRVLHWNGVEWTFAHRPDTSDYHWQRDLRGIAAISPDDVWAVGASESLGYEYSPIVTHWDGTTWTDIDVPRPNSEASRLHDVSAVAHNDVWAVGNAAHATYILHWDGTYWELVPAYNGAENEDLYLYGVHAIATDDVWAFGHHLRGQSIYPIIIHWDGDAWTQQSVPLSDRAGMIVSDINASGPNDVWVLANYYYHYSTFFLHWDGKAWTEVPHEEPGTALNRLDALEVFGPKDVWAVGSTANDSNNRVLVESVRRFTDVSATDYFAEAAFCLADRGVISGYEGCSFRPGNLVSRAQLTKMVVLSADWTLLSPDGATFADVPQDSTFYAYVETAAYHGVIAGYECGGRDSELCDEANRPYFRPGEGVSRGQAAKIVASAAEFNDDPGQPLFADVPPGSAFYSWVQRLARRQVLGGYTCGSNPEEPCGEQGLAYFRPGGDVTRGQAAKIVANTFFAGCATEAPARK